MMIVIPAGVFRNFFEDFVGSLVNFTLIFQ